MKWKQKDNVIQKQKGQKLEQVVVEERGKRGKKIIKRRGAHLD